MMQTGWGEGLFQSQELDSSYYQGSFERKEAFFTKIIKLTELMYGMKIDVSISDICAGKNPHKTNGLYH